MTGTKVYQFFLLILLMIFSTYALDAFLTDGIGNFEYGTDIYYSYRFSDCIKRYKGCSNNDTFKAGPNTRNVLVYIKRLKDMTDYTLRKKCNQQRMDIAAKLLDHSCQLLYLGLARFNERDEKCVVGDFLREVIICHPGVSGFEIVTIGEDKLDVTYGTSPHELTTYGNFTQFDMLGYDLLGALNSLNVKN